MATRISWRSRASQLTRPLLALAAFLAWTPLVLATTQDVEPAVFVATARAFQLYTAVTPALHIVVTDHLQIPPIKLAASVVTVRGACTEPPPNAHQLQVPWQPGQCLLTLSQTESAYFVGSFEVSRGGGAGPLWLANLYLKQANTVGASSTLIGLGYGRDVYLTDVSMEGDVAAATSAARGGPSVATMGMRVGVGGRGRVYAERCHFTGFSGPYGAVLYAYDSSVSLRMCSVAANTDTSTSQGEGGLIQLAQTAALRLEACTIGGNNGRQVYLVFNSTVYADGSLAKVYSGERRAEEAPQPLALAAGAGFLSGSDAWLTETTQRLQAQSASAQPSGRAKRVPVAAIAGGVGMAVATVVAALAVFVWRRLRRLRASGMAGEGLESVLEEGKAGSELNPGTTEQVEVSAGLSEWQRPTVGTTVLNTTRLRAPAHAGFESLEDALDFLSDSETPFLGRFLLLGCVERRFGGQGVVQFARGRWDKIDYAIKFFKDRGAFEREQALYARADLRCVMPTMDDIELNPATPVEGLSDSGFSFPPCIIVERGEAMDEWQRHVQPDFFATMHALCQVLERLQQLHACGLVHRDLKPANVLWQPKMHGWTLIDFGCCAETGEDVRVTFSLRYAPPEVLTAAAARAPTTTAHPAADMWAFGVLAWEMLTGRKAFGRGVDEDEVWDQVLGRASLPWEAAAPADLARLRVLRRPVLRCLERDPAKRPSAGQLYAALNNMFEPVSRQADCMSLDLAPSLVASTNTASEALCTSTVTTTRESLPSSSRAAHTRDLVGSGGRGELRMTSFESVAPGAPASQDAGKGLGRPL